MNAESLFSLAGTILIPAFLAIRAGVTRRLLPASG
jgi:hypothetical protein